MRRINNHLKTESRIAMKNEPNQPASEDFFRKGIPESITAEHVETMLKAIACLSTMMTDALVVIDFQNENFLHVPSHDLFLCGYSQEKVHEIGFDFIKEALHPEDVSLWDGINNTIFNGLDRVGIQIDKINYCAFTLRFYTNVIAIQPAFENNFAYRIAFNFPVDFQQWNNAVQLLRNQTVPFEYVFNVSSMDDCQQSEQLIEQFQIKKYQIKPVYTGDNIGFFEENVFLAKEDILSTPITIKDIFANQAVNLYDFGKINIMPNGDAYANVDHPVLGNIYSHSIYEIVYKEIDGGKSWFRIRNQEPCSNCIYQWLCPPPSNYEIAIGRSNLCHVNNN